MHCRGSEWEIQHKGTVLTVGAAEIKRASLRSSRLHAICLLFRSLQSGENIRHIGLKHEAAHNHFIENVVDLVHVKNEVKLTHVFKATVEGLNKDLNEVKDAQL